MTIRARNRYQTKPDKERSGVILWVLIICALILAGRLAYWYVSDAEQFPINTIKVAATYEHITHQELEQILDNYLNKSFILLPVKSLETDLNALGWVDKASVKKIWPDTLKIQIIEKTPIAIWNNAYMSADGRLFNEEAVSATKSLPWLQGPASSQTEVLQVYQKLSKILSKYELNAVGLIQRENQSWILLLDNEVKIYLGKKNLEARLLRFCKAYPAVFAQKAEQLASVDLRYPRGMAVQWKQQTER